MEAAASPPPPASQSGAFIAKLGAWLQLAPLLILTGVIRLYNVIRTKGAGDPEGFNEALGDTLTILQVSVGLSVAGVILVIIAITACRYRARWMFQFLCFYGLLIIGLNLCLLMMGYFTLGLHLAFAVFFLFFALKKRGEFVNASRKVTMPACYSLDD